MALAKFELKPVAPVVVEAEQIDAAGDAVTVTLSDGTSAVIPATFLAGDWAVKNADGSVTFHTDADFQSKYQPFSG